MRVLAVTNMYPTGDDPTLGTFVEQQVTSLQALGLEVDVLLANRALLGRRVYLDFARQLARRIDQGADLVHVMYGGVMAALATMIAGKKPVLVSFCGSDLLGQNCSGMLRKATSRMGVMASHFAARRATAIVVKSPNLLEALPRTIRERQRIEIIPNGIDLGRFSPCDPVGCRARLGWPEDRLNVLFPANNGDATKRPWLARAAVEQVQRLGIPAILHELSGVPHDTVPDWLNASDVVLLTSEHEGSPNVIKEALACNTAVVSVNVGDVAARVEGVTGCYIADAEPAALAMALAKVHSHRGKVEGRPAVEPLSRETVAVRLRDLYSWCLRTPPPVPTR